MLALLLPQFLFEVAQGVTVGWIREDLGQVGGVLRGGCGVWGRADG